MTILLTVVNIATQRLKNFHRLRERRGMVREDGDEVGARPQDIGTLGEITAEESPLHQGKGDWELDKPP